MEGRAQMVLLPGEFHGRECCRRIPRWVLDIMQPAGIVAPRWDRASGACLGWIGITELPGEGLWQLRYARSATGNRRWLPEVLTLYVDSEAEALAAAQQAFGAISARLWRSQ